MLVPRARRAIAAAILLPFLGAAAVAELPGQAPSSPASTPILVGTMGQLSTREKEAIAFRHLQTELMVAALSCGIRSIVPNTTPSYSATARH
jgi:hypothetical protein